VQKSAGKFLASMLWDQDGILLIDYLPKGQTINQHGVLLVSADAIEGYFEGETPREGHQGGLVLVRQCPGSPRTCNPKDTSSVLITHPILRICPVGLPTVPWTEKKNN